MIPIPSFILVVVFLILSAIHFHWVFGGTWGLENAIPKKDGEPLFKPGKLLTLFVALALLAGAVISVWRGAFPNLGHTWMPRVGTWVIATLFALRAVGDFRYCGFFKRVRGTVFARNDSLVYSPLCVIVSGVALWMAVGY
jgi:hypothetical protein